MTDILYATKNKSKLLHMRQRVEHLDVRILSPDDLCLSLEISEDGKKPSDNARKKALAYYQASGLPCIGADSGLYIDGLAEEMQPGLFVRRVGDKVLSDDEMIEYYAHLAESLGGQANAHYQTGLAYIDDNGEDVTDIDESPFILTAVANTAFPHQGNPLNALAIDPLTHKYFNELTKEEYQRTGIVFEQACLDFIKKHIKKK